MGLGVLELIFKYVFTFNVNSSSFLLRYQYYEKYSLPQQENLRKFHFIHSSGIHMFAKVKKCLIMLNFYFVSNSFLFTFAFEFSLFLLKCQCWKKCLNFFTRTQPYWLIFKTRTWWHVAAGSVGKVYHLRSKTYLTFACNVNAV